MSEQAEAFAAQAETLFIDQMSAFAKWVESNWTFTLPEGNDVDMTPEQAEGWNRCCQSIGGAVKVWLEEAG